jgi:hypothetical protein
MPHEDQPQHLRLRIQQAFVDMAHRLLPPDANAADLARVMNELFVVETRPFHNDEVY